MLIILNQFSKIIIFMIIQIILYQEIAKNHQIMLNQWIYQMVKETQKKIENNWIEWLIIKN